ncbi:MULTISPECIES: hypothetical protein [unclassified Nocardiopsis]|nr:MULTISPECIES: hypothetical protein [unclassified Nocardiopsis]
MAKGCRRLPDLLRQAAEEDHDSVPYAWIAEAMRSVEPSRP